MSALPRLKDEDRPREGRLWGRKGERAKRGGVKGEGRREGQGEGEVETAFLLRWMEGESSIRKRSKRKVIPFSCPPPLCVPFADQSCPAWIPGKGKGRKKQPSLPPCPSSIPTLTVP